METNDEVKASLMSVAEAEIEELIRSLEQVKAGDLEAVEQQVLGRVMALGRRCLEVLVEQQASQQTTARRTGACGHRQRLVGRRGRQVLTLLGPIRIHRAYYQCLLPQRADQPSCAEQCQGTEAPFDQQWGLCPQRSSPGLHKLVSYLAASLTHEEVADVLHRLLPATISARQVGHLMRPVGEAFACWEEEQAQEVLRRGGEKNRLPAEQQEEEGEPVGRLYVEMDGVMARLRRGSVPMEAQEVARGGDVYREVKVGAVFVGEQGPERSELAPGVFVDTAGPLAYVACRASVDAFAPRLYALAQRAGVVRAREVVVLGDGAKWIWRLAEEQFPGAVQIVDEYHARQHVWEVARAAFASDPAARQGWAKTVLDQLAQGQIEAVIAAMEALPPLAPAAGQARSVAQIEAEYFRTNASRMRYPAFRAQGMQVGSGIAEAACKTVVSTRAKRAGMRWTPEGLDVVLALRVAVLNRVFEQRWRAYKEAA